jgi:hypothetical protein
MELSRFGRLDDGDGQIAFHQALGLERAGEERAQHFLRPYQVHPHRQTLAGEDRPVDFRVGRPVGAHRVNSNVSQHGVRS